MSGKGMWLVTRTILLTGTQLIFAKGIPAAMHNHRTALQHSDECAIYEPVSDASLDVERTIWDNKSFYYYY